MQKVFHDEMLRAQHERHPFMSKIPILSQTEGSRSDYETSDGQIVEMKYKAMKVQRSWKYEEATGMKPEVFLEFAASIGEEVADIMSDDVLNAIFRSTEQTGNVVHSTSGITFEAFVEMSEMISTDFDEAGEMREKTLVVSPDVATQLRFDILQWKADPEKMAKIKQIEEQHRLKFHERETRRTMVD